MEDKVISSDQYKQVIKKYKLKIIEQQKRIKDLQNQLQNYDANDVSAVIDKEFKDSSKQTLQSLFQELNRNCRNIGLTPEMLFRACDLNLVGEISVDSFRLFLRKLKLNLTTAQSNRIASEFDLNLTGTITRDQYLELLQVYGINQEPSQLKPYWQNALINFTNLLTNQKISPEDAYNQLDQQNQGYFNQQAFDQFCNKQLKQQLSQNDVISLFNHWDNDKLDQINRNQFVQDIKKVQGLIKSNNVSTNQFLPQQISQVASGGFSSFIQPTHSATVPKSLGSTQKHYNQQSFGDMNSEQQFRKTTDQFVRNVAQTQQGQKANSQFNFNVSERRLKPNFKDLNTLNSKKFDNYVHKLCPQISNQHRMRKRYIENGLLKYQQQHWDTIFNDLYAALKYCQQQVSKLKVGELWVDHEFGPNNEDPKGALSMYIDPNKEVDSEELYKKNQEGKILGVKTENKKGILPGMPKPEDTEWLFPKEILQRKIQAGHSQYSKGGKKDAKAANVVQSKYLGNCWFISALCLISQDDGLLRGRFVPNMENLEEISNDEAQQMISGVYPPLFHYLCKYGIYVMRFFKDGKYRYVVIDSKLPVISKTDEIIYGQCRSADELWVSLIEKAYAKIHQCYGALCSGDIAQGLADMTGLVADKQMIDGKYLDENRDDKDGLWQLILDNCTISKELGQSNNMLGCSAIGPEGFIVYKGQSCGILSGHAYAIIDAIEVEWSKDEEQYHTNYHGTHRLIRVYNPWGHGE